MAAYSPNIHKNVEFYIISLFYKEIAASLLTVDVIFEYYLVNI